MPLSFRVRHADGTGTVVEIDGLLENLHPHTDPIETLVALSFENSVQVRMVGNLIATVSLYHNEQDDLPLLQPPARQQYAARVGLTFHAETDVYVNGVASVDEASELIDRWQGGDRTAQQRISMDAHQLIDSLRESVDQMARRGDFGGADLEVIGVSPSPYPLLNPPK